MRTVFALLALVLAHPVDAQESPNLPALPQDAASSPLSTLPPASPAPSLRVASPAPAVAGAEAWWGTTLHAQTTVIIQKHNDFHSPYAGINSVPADEGRKTSLTATIYAGVRLGSGTELYIDPEVAGGEGFGGVIGIAGFPNGDIARVGSSAVEPYLARFFLRQTLNLEGEREEVADGINQVATHRSRNRLVLTIGRVAASDAFDNNTYSHDPRSQFMNWALMSNGAWDYAADSHGYTDGLILECTAEGYSLRYGMFAMPSESNGAQLDAHVRHALEYVLEGEGRWSIAMHPGTLRVLCFDNHEHMGNYRKALELAPPGGVPDITSARSNSAKIGLGINCEQALGGDVGVFSRLGWNDGHTETWAFAEIDRTCSLGLQVTGGRWHRPQDTAACAGVANAISRSHREYLAAGGAGFFLGDGRLHYGYEKIIEVYYSAQVHKNLVVTPDWQYIDNPGYNRDRGPIEVWGVRVHLDL